MLKRLVLVAAVLALLGAPAFTEVTSNEWFPIDGWFWYDPCNDEELQTFGSYHEVISFTEKDGEYKWRYLVNAHATGVGQTSGNEYVFNDTFQRKEEGILGGSWNQVFTWKTRFVTKGQPTNAYLVFKVFMSYSPEGGLVSETIRDSVQCSGQ